MNNFITSPSLNITIRDGQTVNNRPAQFGNVTITDNYKFEGILLLDLDFVPDFSQEAIVAVLVHEVLHASMRYSGNIDQLSHHVTMSTKYILPMAQYLTNKFPNLLAKDALALTYGGLGDIMADVGEDHVFTHTIDGNSVSITKSEAAYTSFKYQNSKQGTEACKTIQGN